MDGDHPSVSQNIYIHYILLYKTSLSLSLINPTLVYKSFYFVEYTKIYYA